MTDNNSILVENETYIGENAAPDDAPKNDGHDDHGHAQGSSILAHDATDPAAHDATDHSAGEGGWADQVTHAMGHYLNPDHLISHVQDAYYFEGFGVDDHGHKNKFEIPWISPFTEDKPFMGENGFIEVSKDNQFIGPATFQPSKFVILELIGALIVCAIFIPYARRIKNGDRPKGRFWNMIDSTVCYVRDEIAVPSIGSQDAKRFLPLIWSVFFFVLTLNLIGMIPSMGAATGSISVTTAFALVVFIVVMATGMKKMGVVGFIKAQAPQVDIHPAMKLVLIPMIWAIEIFGLLLKHVVLAVRLFANMFAGHMVVGVFVAFIGVTWGTWLMYPTIPVVILSTIAINLLELLVAFIQAYVFAFLTSLFIGTAIHPH